MTTYTKTIKDFTEIKNELRESTFSGKESRLNSLKEDFENTISEIIITIDNINEILLDDFIFSKENGKIYLEYKYGYYGIGINKDGSFEVYYTTAKNGWSLLVANPISGDTTNHKDIIKAVNTIIKRSLYFYKKNQNPKLHY